MQLQHEKIYKNKYKTHTVTHAILGQLTLGRILGEF